MNKQKLLHGQALAMQWVGFALQSIIADIHSGGSITKQLMGSAKSVGNGNDLKTVAIGCNYVVNFVLPFAIELALKALLAKTGQGFKFTHDLLALYNKFSPDIKGRLQSEFIIQLEKGGCPETGSFEDLLTAHKNDFVDWRYLDKAEKLKKEEKEMHLAICAILEIYNSDSVSP